MSRKINACGLALIKSFETLRLEAYDDATGLAVPRGGAVTGVLTLGYGHTRGVMTGDTCNELQADLWLQQDLAIAEACVSDAVKAPLSDNRFAALVSFVFNIGSAAFLASTLLKQLNKGRYGDVPAELARWNKSKGAVSNGLTRRRSAEAALWASGNDNAAQVMCPTVAPGEAAGACANKPVDVPPSLFIKAKTVGIAVSGSAPLLGEAADKIAPLVDYGHWLKASFLILSLLAAVLTLVLHLESHKE